MAPTPSVQLRPRTEKQPRGRLVVSMPSRPPAYQPGSGPPLQRIRLLPPRDSTAYIVERILLPSPGPAANGKPLPKRMTYIVGWPDLPAARLLVPAMEILEYVSPRALEEWEANMELELDEDRLKLAQEQEASGPQRKTDKKARPPAHTDIESAAVAEPESDTQTRHKMSAMSLSTPKKARLEDFEGFTDYEDGSPSRQLARETAWQNGVDDQGDLTRVISDVQGLPTGFSDGLNLQAGGASGWLADNDDLAGIHETVPWRTKQLAFASNTQSSSLQTLRGGDDPSQTVSGSFTPLNRNRRLLSMPEASRRSGALQPSADAMEVGTSSKKQSKPRKKGTPAAKKAKPAPAPPVDENGQQVWVVKRIEEMQLYEVEGRGVVRYFRVLWEGDWPPDQNPTWEPEDNLPKNLVRNYFKRGKKRRKRMAYYSKSKQVALGANMHYNSVSEAFAGDVDDDGLALGDDETGAGGQSEQGEELVVIEDQHDTVGSSRASALAWL
ncbi:hypothetical protein XA68_10039 [Ophiocordyceps unilateralis]|uniref:Chromo domain-containing protein n=1 Tax=Ophiocordyceps unilateralis TaxID=268505 RepID=A0A2A9PW03_OPHUN|nr:hypothetical protein XA68_10039 [Ophiocordyceps unilateralis]